MSRRGTKDLRRSFRGFGTIRIASGTHDVKTIARLNEMLTTLYESSPPRLDWLGALRERQVTPLELLGKLRGITPADLPAPSSQPFTPEAVVAWADRYPASARHRQDLRQNIRRLAERTTDVAQLPRVLRELRDDYQRRGQPHAFAHLRFAALSYLRDTVGRRHAAYQDILELRGLPLVRKREGHPCTALEVFATADALGPYFAEVWMTYVLAGVGPKELYEDGVEEDAATGHLHVLGAKAKGRDRLIPLVEVRRGARVYRPLTGRPDVSRRMFEKRFRAATEGRLEPYDGRRTFARLMALARIPPIHIDSYMGHGPKTITELYQRGNEAPYLERDAALDAAFIEAELDRFAGTLEASGSLSARHPALPRLSTPKGA